jgi:hypothetical protein
MRNKAPLTMLLSRVSKLSALILLLLIVQLPVYVSHFIRAVLDPDIYWHLRVGEWILRNHTFPQVGIFSQYAQGHGWIAYSWGFEVLMAWLFRFAGLAAIPVALGVARAVIAFTIFVVLLCLSQRFWLSWLVTAAALFPLSSILVIRPVLFTILFFTIEIGLIFQARRRGSVKPLYWLPLLFLVWANVHIQFVYGLFLLALYAACELLNRIFRGEKSSWISRCPIDTPAIRIILISLLSFCVTFLGPYGARTYFVIFHYAGNTSTYNQITELLALGFRDWGDYFVVILLMAVCFSLGRKGIDLFTGSLIFSAAMVSFRSSRDAWFIVLVCAALIAEAARGDEVESSPMRTAWHLQYAAAFVLAVTAAFGYAERVGLTPQNLIGAVDSFYPVRATEYVRDHHLPGPMYNSFNWGGFLIFNLREYPVSIDGRNDLYGPAVGERVRNTMQGIDWKSDPGLARANFVLIERGDTLAKLLAIDPDFKLVYADNLAVIFTRNHPVPSE